IQNGIGSVDALSVVSKNIFQAVINIGCNPPRPGVLEVNVLPGLYGLCYYHSGSQK
ncbi:hypothetical protein Pmar_PMAR014265, partial [Perkinsus marinus ATCC 50983]